MLGHGDANGGYDTGGGGLLIDHLVGDDLEGVAVLLAEALLDSIKILLGILLEGSFLLRLGDLLSTDLNNVLVVANDIPPIHETHLDLLLEQVIQIKEVTKTCSFTSTTLLIAVN